MGNHNRLCTINLIAVILICYVTSTLSIEHGNETSLHVGFYNKSCPQAERTVREVVLKAVSNESGIAASLLRLFFHDCFVNGCDASILLDKTQSGEPVEKTSRGNVGVRGFEVIDKVKTELEKACPNTVSCADIISFVARDAAVISNIASFEMPAGRRDGLKSIAQNISGNLPVPNSNVKKMEEIFIKKGMNKSDIVTLLGVHSIGVAHCSLFEKDFHNFNSTNKPNPKLNSGYALIMRNLCPLSDNSSKSNEDRVFPLNINKDKKLSTAFYGHVLGGRVAIPADQSLLDDEFTSKMVRTYATQTLKWASDFRDALIKLGKVDVLTGEQGEIRKNCRVMN